MKIDNITDRLLSGPLKFIGYILLFFSLYALFRGAWLLGIPFLAGASFFIFTVSGVEIDTAGRRIKQYNKFFGIIKTGCWRCLDQYIGVTLVPMRRVGAIVSRANLFTPIISHDYRIFLVNKIRKPAVAIKTCKNREQAQASLDEFSIWLKMPVFSIKK